MTLYNPIYDEATLQADDDAPGLRALRKMMIEEFELGCYGILSKRKVRGGQKMSVHSEGRAWDAKCDAKTERLKGDNAAMFLWSKHRELGIQKIIWNCREISVLSPEWKDYEGAVTHTNHLHIEMNRSAARGVDALTVTQVREVFKEWREGARK